MPSRNNAKSRIPPRILCCVLRQTLAKSTKSKSRNEVGLMGVIHKSLGKEQRTGVRQEACVSSCTQPHARPYRGKSKQKVKMGLVLRG